MRVVSLYFQSLLYILAGLNHFRKPLPYASIIPRWLPWPVTLVYVSGVAEILLGTLLLFNITRRIAALGIIALLIAVFPANIQMAVDYMAMHHPAAWLTIVRLPVQLLLIWLAWPFARKKERVPDGL